MQTIYKAAVSEAEAAHVIANSEGGDCKLANNEPVRGWF